MATQNINFTVTLNGITQTIDSVESLGKNFTDVQNEIKKTNQIIETSGIGSETFIKASERLNELELALGKIQAEAKNAGFAFESAFNKANLAQEELKNNIESGLAIDKFIAASGQIAETLIDSNELIQLSNEGASDSLVVLERAARSYLVIQVIRNSTEALYNTTLIVQNSLKAANIALTEGQTAAQTGYNTALGITNTLLGFISKSALGIGVGLVAVGVIFTKIFGGISGLLEKATASFDGLVSGFNALISLQNPIEAFGKAYKRSLDIVELEKKIKDVDKYNKGLERTAALLNALASNPYGKTLKEINDLEQRALELKRKQIENSIELFTFSDKNVDAINAQFAILLNQQSTTDEIIAAEKELNRLLVDENKNQENINLILDKKDQLNKVIFEQGALINKNRQEELTLEKEQNLANTQRRLDSINTILTQETLSAKQIQSISQTRQSLELKLIDERLRILKQLDQENILTQEQQLELTNIQKERETQLSKIFIENQKLRSDVLDQELAKIKTNFETQISYLETIKSNEGNNFATRIAAQEKLNETSLKLIQAEINTINQKKTEGIATQEELLQLVTLESDLLVKNVENQKELNTLLLEQGKIQIENSQAILDINAQIQDSIDERTKSERDLATTLLDFELSKYEQIGQNLNSIEGVLDKRAFTQATLNEQLEIERLNSITKLENTLRDLDVQGEILTLKRQEVELAYTLGQLSEEQYKNTIAQLDLQQKVIEESTKTAQVQFNIDSKQLDKKGFEGAQAIEKGFIDGLRGLLNPQSAFANLIGDASESVFKNITEEQKKFLTESVTALANNIKAVLDFAFDLAVKKLDQKIEELNARKQKLEDEQQLLEDSLTSIEDRISTLQQLLDEAEGSRRAALAQQLERETALRDKQTEAILGNAEALEDLKKQEAELQKEREVAGKKQERLNRILALSQAALTAAYAVAAVTRTASESGVASPVFVATTVGAIAAGIGVVLAAISAAQPSEYLADGGVIQGASHSQGGVRGSGRFSNVEVEGQEYVVNRKSSQKYKPLLDRINNDKYATGGVLQPNFNALNNLSTQNTQQLQNQTIQVSVVDIVEGINRVSVIDQNSLI